MDKTKQGGAAGVLPVFISSLFPGLFPGEDPGVACEAGRISWRWSCHPKRAAKPGFSTLLEGPPPKQHSHAAPASYPG